ncbi:MAG TPA: LacI family DNA-binding transcriptional regulator [Anaerolineaceae bacterium]|nr:LacI family DNA-binding transcriptional regulator [Anaerolineaceae bacterium]
MTTITEVARKAGVSPTTVSHVLNDTRFVSEGVRTRVQAAMSELGYQPNALARSLRRGETQTIGLVLPDSANLFFAEIGRAIEDAAFRHGYSVVLCNTEGDSARERVYTDVLSKKQVDGMVFVATGEEDGVANALEHSRLPLILVDRELQIQNADAVLTDNFQGGWLAAQHLLAQGHTALACISGPSRVNPSAERVTGFCEALRAAGLPVEPDRICRGDFHPESGYQNALELLRAPQRPTALFVCNDLMAIGVLRAAAELGLRVPADLSVIGFDDIELAEYTLPPLTTIAQPKQQVGQLAIDLLLERIGEPALPARRVVLPVELIARHSTGPAPELIHR